MCFRFSTTFSSISGIGLAKGKTGMFIITSCLADGFLEQLSGPRFLEMFPWVRSTPGVHVLVLTTGMTLADNITSGI